MRIEHCESHERNIPQCLFVAILSKIVSHKLAQTNAPANKQLFERIIKLIVLVSNNAVTQTDGLAGTGPAQQQHGARLLVH